MNIIPKHIVIQAGGRGSRLRHHTWNKPKCLVSVRGKPIMYHLFDRFPNSEFHIIGDYMFDQLKTYLTVNKPKVKYTLYQSQSAGTTSGLAGVVKNVEDFLLVWGDLIINQDLELTNNPTLITTDAFTCRWVYKDNKFIEETTVTDGVPGLFYFPDKSDLKNIPDGQEFLEWLKISDINFNVFKANELEELGDFKRIEIENDRNGFSRFFNKVTIHDTYVTKIAIDKDYQHLIEKEQHWYNEVSKLGFKKIPVVLNNEPYTLSRIIGNHAYEIKDLTNRERRAILANYIESLSSLHDLSTCPSTHDDLAETYIHKTLSRVNSVSALIPNFDKEVITINGIKCRNFFTEKYKSILLDTLPKLMTNTFVPIHGDPTFSNSIIDNNLKVWYIDPRGYFGNTLIYGDRLYDFAKVYYSAVGNYDSFNRKKFKLFIDNETVEILLPTTDFENVADEVFNEYFSVDLHKIKIIHGLLWLSLSGYAKDDIDSIISAFFNGLYWLEQEL